MKQTILRNGNFDSAHRIVNHPGKCANLHGHTYLFEVELEFDNGIDPEIAQVEFENELPDMGYAVDFGDVKSTVLKYIDDVYDHGSLINPKDSLVAPFFNSPLTMDMRRVEMYLNGKDQFCNPSVENIALQLLIELKLLFDSDQYVVKSVKLHETPQCWTVATLESLPRKWIMYAPKHLLKWKSKNQ